MRLKAEPLTTIGQRHWRQNVTIWLNVQWFVGSFSLTENQIPKENKGKIADHFMMN